MYIGKCLNVTNIYEHRLDNFATYINCYLVPLTKTCGKRNDLNLM